MLLLVIMFWMVCVAVGAVIGNARGNVTAGILLSLFLGVIGVLIVCFVDLDEGPPAQKPTV